MNKFGLVQKMAALTDLSPTECKKAVEAFMEIVIANLRNHEDTFLTGFGTFTAMKRKSRTGVNPQTGKKIKIPEAYVAKFRPSKHIKKLPKSSKI